MSLNIDKSAWKRVAFGDVVKNVNVTAKEGKTAGTTRVVGLEHLDPGEMKIRRWGSLEDGTTFTRRAQPGQTLFGKRRAYQRKAAYVEFEAVTSSDLLVFEADAAQLLPELLPFLVHSDGFYDHALATSAGSLSPRTNWRDLANFQFDLPPLDEQKRLADLLWAVERHRLALVEADTVLTSVEAAWTRDVLADLDWSLPLIDIVRGDRPLCYGVVQPGADVEDGVELLRVMDLESGTPNRPELKRIARHIDLQYRRSRVVTGDVLVSIVGTIGRTWVVTEEFEGCNIARALARVSPRPEVMVPEFLGWVLSSERLQSTLASAAFESARKTLNLSALAQVTLPRVSVIKQHALLGQRNEFSVARTQVGDEASAIAEMRRALLKDIFGGSRCDV